MEWVAAVVIMVFVMAGLLWLLSLGDPGPSQGGLHSGHHNASADPEAFIRPPPEGPYGGSGRLELPPGPEGHLMAAEALHRATGMYKRACEERMR